MSADSPAASDPATADPSGRASAARVRYPRWLALVVLAGILATLGGMYLVDRPRGVYWARCYVSFFIPYSGANNNVVSVTPYSLVMTAGAVAKIVDPSGGKELLADQTASLASEGITHGWTVTIPNSGSQWRATFTDALLQIETVGTTPGEVTASMAMVIGRVRRAFDALQDSQRIARRNEVTIRVSPPGPPLVVFQGERKVRALAAVALLGFGGTLIARYAARRIVRRRLVVTA